MIHSPTSKQRRRDFMVLFIKRFSTQPETAEKYSSINDWSYYELLFHQLCWASSGPAWGSAQQHLTAPCGEIPPEPIEAQRSKMILIFVDLILGYWSICTVKCSSFIFHCVWIQLWKCGWQTTTYEVLAGKIQHYVTESPPINNQIWSFFTLIQFSYFMFLPTFEGLNICLMWIFVR